MTSGYNIQTRYAPKLFRYALSISPVVTSATSPAASPPPRYKLQTPIHHINLKPIQPIKLIIHRIGAPDPSDPNAKPSPDDPKIVLSVVGFAADANALRERLDTAVKMYRYQHNRTMSLSACAQRLSHILYGKRFFPFYVTCILGGLDETGKGALYSYDPVGSYEREQCRSAGAASSLIMPFLDNQVCSSVERAWRYTRMLWTRRLTPD